MKTDSEIPLSYPKQKTLDFNQTVATTIYPGGNFSHLDVKIKQDNCFRTAFRYIAVGIAVACLVVGVGGLLISIGKLQVGWAEEGMLLATTGFYITAGGFGGFAITVIVFAVSYCLENAKANGAKERRYTHTRIPQAYDKSIIYDKAKTK